MKTKKQSNRNHVISVAADLFLLRGYGNTSMDEVVKESKVSKSNIYYHFPSKDDLLLAVVDWRIHQFEEGVNQLITQHSGSITQLLSQYLKMLFDEISGRNCIGGCPFISMFKQLSTEKELVREKISAFFKWQKNKFEVFLTEGMKQGEFRKDIPINQISQLFITSIEGALLMAEVHQNPQIIEDTGETLLQLIR